MPGIQPVTSRKVTEITEQFSKRVKDCRLRVQMSRNYKFYHFASHAHGKMATCPMMTSKIEQKNEQLESCLPLD